MANSTAEMLVKALCSMMGVDMSKMGPQVIGTMDSIKRIQEQIASIEDLCKNNAVALARIEQRMEHLENRPNGGNTGNGQLHFEGHTIGQGLTADGHGGEDPALGTTGHRP